MIIVNNYEELSNAIKNINQPELRYVNNGIGSYEYWGAKGVDKRMEWEIESDIVKIQLNFKFDEDEIIDVIEDAVATAEYQLDQDLNRHHYDDVDYTDIVKLHCEHVDNIITLEWMEA